MVTQGLPIRSLRRTLNLEPRTSNLDPNPERWVPASRSYQTLGSWYPWMRMGHESGGISFQMIGRKLRTRDTLIGVARPEVAGV